MHPAKSLIFFTSASGVGFGLLAFLGLGIPNVEGWGAFIFFAIAFGLAGSGLIASTFHLGHPERALKAFSQWRTSWLSREAWLACATLTVMGIYAFMVIFLDIRIWPLGVIGSALSLVTVYATSMIYGQLATVPRWNHWTTPAMFIALSLSGGALVAGLVWISIVLLALSGGLQFYTWKIGDALLGQSGSTIATATGLGHMGHVRSFEAPHTGGSYLTREMVFIVARKHALKLRSIALVLAFIVPIILLFLPLFYLMAVLAILSHLVGLAILRWLFFAQAEHVVGLYYGRT